MNGSPIAFAAVVPSWIAGGCGWLGNDVNLVVFGMLLSIAAPVLAYGATWFLPALQSLPETRRSVQRSSVPLALLLAIATFLLLLFSGIPAACDGGYECPV